MKIYEIIAIKDGNLITNLTASSSLADVCISLDEECCIVNVFEWDLKTKGKNFDTFGISKCLY